MDWYFIKKEIGNAKFTFWVRSRNTRHGFAHDAELWMDGKMISSDTAHYLNRTWEAYQFQSVMRGAVHNAINDARAMITAEEKEKRGWKRLTVARKNEIEAIIDENSGIMVLRELDEHVKNRTYGTEEEGERLKTLDAMLAVLEVLFGRTAEQGAA